MANSYAAHVDGFGCLGEVEIFPTAAERNQYLQDHIFCEAITAKQAKAIAMTQRWLVTHSGARVPSSWATPQLSWVNRWKTTDPAGEMICDLA